MRAGEKRPRRAGRLGSDAGQRRLVLEVLVQQVTPHLPRHAGHGVVAHVSVDLLRPVGGEAGEVGPEAAVLVPVLKPRLVEGEVGRRLADPGDEHRSAHGGQRPVPVVEPVEECAHVGARVAGSLAHGRRELVQRPRVAGCHVVAGRGHAPPRLDAGLVPGAAVRRDPRRPAGDADLGEGVERRPECTDAPGLIGSQLGLVRRQRRHGDVVLRAGRLRRRQLRRQAEPVRRRVEDRAQRAALGRPQRLHTRPPDELAPQPLGSDGRQRGHRPHGRVERSGRAGGHRAGHDTTAEHEQPSHHRNPSPSEQRAE